jgi:hypothetical protein
MAANDGHGLSWAHTATDSHAGTTACIKVTSEAEQASQPLYSRLGKATHDLVCKRCSGQRFGTHDPRTQSGK